MAEKTTPPAPAATPPTGDKAKTNGLTKMDAVRKALDALGPRARPVEIQGFVNQHFGVEMTPGHAKTCKTKALAERTGKAKGAKKPAPRKAAAGKLAAPKPTAASSPAPKAAPPAKASAPSIGLGDIEAVKGLVGRVGIEQLKGLIDLFAK